MTDTAHTPGPWKCGLYGGFYIEDSMGERTRPTQPDMDLIASAPQLYEALEHALEIITKHVDPLALGITEGNEQYPSWPTLVEEMHYMENAIKAARGEQS